MWNDMEAADPFGASFGCFAPVDDADLSTFDLDCVDLEFPDAPSPLMDDTPNTTCVSGDPFFAPGPASPPPPPSAFVQEPHSFVEGWLMENDPFFNSDEPSSPATVPWHGGNHDGESPASGGDVPRIGGGQGAHGCDNDNGDTCQKVPRVNKRQPPRSPSILLDNEPPPPVMPDVIHGPRHPGFVALTSTQQASSPTHRPQPRKGHSATLASHSEPHAQQQPHDCSAFEAPSSMLLTQAPLSQTTDDACATAPVTPWEESVFAYAPDHLLPHACGGGPLFDAPCHGCMGDMESCPRPRASSSSISSCMSSTSSTATRRVSTSTSPPVPATCSAPDARGPHEGASSHPAQHWREHKQQQQAQQHPHQMQWQQQLGNGQVSSANDTGSSMNDGKESHDEEEQARVMKHWSYRLAMRQHVQRELSRLPSLISVRVCSHIPRLRPAPRQPTTPAYNVRRPSSASSSSSSSPSPSSPPPSQPRRRSSPSKPAASPRRGRSGRTNNPDRRRQPRRCGR